LIAPEIISVYDMEEIGKYADLLGFRPEGVVHPIVSPFGSV
jgi:hypothetical protein